MEVSEHPKLQLVGIEDVDQAISDWFDKTLDAHVVSPNRERQKVTVLFGSGERFATSRTQNSGIRDDKGVLILPILTIRRSMVSPDASMQSFGVETPTLSFSRRVDVKTRDLKNLNVLRQPGLRVEDPVVYEIHTVPFPRRSIISYEIMIQTQYIIQMNSIIEKLFSCLELQRQLVAPINNNGRQPLRGIEFEERQALDVPYVVGFFDGDLSSGDNLEEFTDQERIIQWKSTLTVPASLQIDPEGMKPSVKVERTAFKTIFPDEQTHFVDDPAELDAIFGKKPW